MISGGACSRVYSQLRGTENVNYTLALHGGHARPFPVTRPRCPLRYNWQSGRCERQQRVKNNSHARDTNTRFGMEGNRVLDTRVCKSSLAAAPQTPDQQKHEQNHLHSRQGAGEDERSLSPLFPSLPSLALFLPANLPHCPASQIYYFLCERYFSDREQIQRGEEIRCRIKSAATLLRDAKIFTLFQPPSLCLGSAERRFREERKRWVGSARQLIGIRCVLGVD